MAARTGQHTGALRRLEDAWLAPGERQELDCGGAGELISYVIEGAVALDLEGRTDALVSCGEVRSLWVGTSQSVRCTNVSDGPTHVISVALRGRANSGHPPPAQRFFSSALRRGVWCALAAADGRRGALPLMADALLLSALMEPGQHLVRALEPGSAARLHVVSGEIRSAGFVLTAGDGARVTAERAVSLTALATSEVLLCELA